MFPLGWLNQLLGLAMNGIDWCMYHLLGVHNVGWCIVIFTLFVLEEQVVAPVYDCQCAEEEH